MSQEKQLQTDVPVRPAWRVGVFVVVQVVLLVVVLAGYDLQTALTCTAGGGLAAAHVARNLFGAPSEGREKR
ncbi:hypothetical protein ABZ467_33535 [Streptomyces sp. NPDC005727]|uniref:hypothetical protein n=1 Tax=Streptomyces sp. NPDC005727 TaxID=3157053 RepID=UPI0033E98AFF